mgnify:FL=1
MAFLQAIQTTLLRYQSPRHHEQDLYFSCARNLARAQFQLADEELSRRLWQDVAERELDVDRILNLMYGCWFQEDREAMQEADAAYCSEQLAGGVPSFQVGIFEHC